ncbi:MarR family transcriptional regulator [Sphingobium indicum IP26]|uniref:MarR family transcriptional regulator n=1 Tax=Sphingobium indicum F2 TaxID=1450518 RepID=A0A8E0WR89_9SPHN|nr:MULTISPECIES: MarR family transcriptional regulator [Sphingobium]EPR14961.1 MarR family transcriptional regulator [Sphingobium indicum IP26]EQB02269.1 MarR family transcriptional regulator [Sphingobium sp. HDIP04]KER35867.1 MarR family transcriptional regulator [Sphingobium indicum F2]
MTDKVLRLDAFIPYRLSFTAALLSDAVAQSYEDLFGIGIAEWRVIAWVAERGSITQQQICAMSRMDKVTVSRAAIALTGRGVLRRLPKAEDRRSHLLALTEEGERLHAAIAPKALELESGVFSHFSAEEVEAFVGMLRRIDAVVLGS